MNDYLKTRLENGQGYRDEETVERWMDCEEPGCENEGFSKRSGLLLCRTHDEDAEFDAAMASDGEDLIDPDPSMGGGF